MCKNGTAEDSLSYVCVFLNVDHSSPLLSPFLANLSPSLLPPCTLLTVTASVFCFLLSSVLLTHLLSSALPAFLSFYFLQLLADL